jgi:hypothetical protein
MKRVILFRRDAEIRRRQILIERIKGVPAQSATSESDGDPRNPNMASEPKDE